MYLERFSLSPAPGGRRQFDGVDVFVEWHGTGEELAARLEAKTDWGGPFELAMVSNFGTQLHQDDSADASPHHWQCRFLYDAWDPNIEEWISVLLRSVAETAPWMHVEKLMSVDGTPGYAQAQAHA